MAKNSNNIFQWGAGAEGVAGGVWVANQPASGGLASGAPTSSSGTYASGNWFEIGWLSSDGITEAHSVDAEAKYAWQGLTRVKTVKSNEVRSFQFMALEENAVVLGLARPGSTVTSGASETVTQVKSSLGQDRRSFGLDLIVGDSIKRIIIPDGEVTEYGDVVYKSDDITVYQFTVTVYADANGLYYTEYNTAPGVLSA